MRRSLVLVQVVLLSFVLLFGVGCRKLLAGLAKGDDAGTDGAAAVASADPAASATASATASAPAPTVTSTAVTAKAAPPKCAKGESLIEFESGSRGCATECIDPSCSCEIGFAVLPNGKVSSAPGDRRSFCPKAKAAAKKAVPKCPAGQSLFAEDDSSPLFCSKSCSKDADCKPATCNQNLFNADETGTIFAGVGKQVFACNKGFGAGAAAPGASAGPASSAIVLAVPPGSPPIIQNPNGQPCPVGYGNGAGVLRTCNKKCDGGGKCPVGSKCDAALLVCR